MRINHNISAINAHRQLASNQGSTSKALQKLSSGLRINSAGDDAAGLAISEKMRAQIKGLDKAQSNAQDSISLIQTAEGALQQVSDILQRMRELGVQSMNGILSDSEKDAIASEMTQLRQEVDRIAETSKFNNTYLLKGTLGMAPDLKSTIYQTGTTDLLEGMIGLDISAAEKNTQYDFSLESITGYKEVEDASVPGALKVVELKSFEIESEDVKGITVTDGDYVFKSADGSFMELTLNGTYLEDGAGHKYASVATDADGNVTGLTALDSVSGTPSMVTTLDADKEVSLGKAGITASGLKAGDYVKVDTPKETKLVVRYTGIDDKAKIAVCSANIDEPFSGFVSFRDANQADAGIRIQVADFDLTVLADKNVSTLNGGKAELHIGANSVDAPLQIEIPDLRARALGIDELSIVTTDDAKQTLDKIDAALSILNSARGNLGAYQNRLEYTLNSLAASSENLTAAESRIRDVDMAKEMMAYTQANILNQSATAMLAQANQQPQSVLQLLQGL